MIFTRRALISSSLQKKLDTLEVAHRHAARIGDHVGQHQDAAVVQDVVRLRRGWAVGAFNHHLGLDAARVGFGDLLLQCGGNQNVARHTPEGVIGHHFGLLKTGHRAVAGHVRQQGGHIQPGFAVNGAAVVLHRHHRGPGLGKQLGRDAAHVAKTLHGNFGF